MTNKNPIEDLKEIRKMMESSSKFLSLSGLSGIFAGATALLGAWLAYLEIEKYRELLPYFYLQGRLAEGEQELSIRLFLIAIGILIVALAGGFFFTWLKAKKQKKQLFTALSLRLIISLAVPLFFGGLFIIGLYYHGAYPLIAPATLIVYGMTLLNGSKYVHVDIKYLALCEMALGVIAIFKLHYGFTAWIIGFGVLHILYGTIMYFKYDRN